MSSEHNVDGAYYHENDDHLDFSSTHLEQHDIDHNRPSSIDMSLELERQLDAEHESEEHPEPSANNSTTGEKERPISLDPVILSGIVAGLRENLAEMTKERDSLVETVTLSHAREAELKEALALVTERCSALEDEVGELRRKSQDDDDAISMLRAKVEESRRGLMRLQTESKRMSQISTLQSLDTGRANSFFSNGPPSSSKRMSFTPLTGSGAARVNPHRRTSSVSEAGFAYLDASNDSFGAQNSPPTRVTSLPEENEGKARRASGFFARAKSSPSPPQLPRQLSPEPPHFDSAAAQLEMLKRERDTARAELQTVKLELSETQEACEASNQCVHALRTFISDHSIGEGSGSSGSASAASGLKLPPLPTDKDADREEPVEPRKSLSGGSGWSIGKLWRVDTASEHRNSISSNTGSTIVSPGGAGNDSASSTPTASSNAPPVAPSAQTGGLSRKFTGFFSSRASTSSGQPQPGAPTPKEVPTPHGYEEPMFNGMGSDGEGEAEVSSVDDESLEPRSPEHEPAQAMVLVRDASASSVGSSSVLNADASNTTAKSLPTQQQAEAEEVPSAL